MRPYNQWRGKKTRSEFWSENTNLMIEPLPPIEETTLAVQQAKEIALLYDVLDGEKNNARLKQRLLSLKQRWDDPCWHQHLCGHPLAR
jgi:hypothetical protein